MVPEEQPFFEETIPAEQQPLVSILLSYYNDRQFLTECVGAVLAQDYQNWELIMMDHGSTDDSPQLARSFTDPRIRHLSYKRNLGAGSGYMVKLMLDAARGEFIKTLCADDVLYPDCLSSLVLYFKRHPDKDLCFGDAEYVDRHLKSYQRYFFTTRNFFSLDNDEADCIRWFIARKSMLPFTANLTRTRAMRSVRLNYTYIDTFDVALWLSLLCKGYKIGYLNRPVVKYRIHSGQTSSLKNRARSMVNCYYEHADYWKIATTITDLQLARRVWFDSPYVLKLRDPQDIPFFAAVNMFDNFKQPVYLFLNELVNDEQKGPRILEVFGFGVKELRETAFQRYYRMPVGDSLWRLWVGEVYNARGITLGWVRLLFLLGRKLYRVLTLQIIIDLWRSRHDWQKFSL